jgi:hypothetical protein
MLKIIIDSLDAVDDAYHSLYTEKDGKFELTGVEGLKTEADISRLNTALVKEREAHKSTKEKYSILGSNDPHDILAKLDRIPELEAAAAGNLDDTKINDIVETRIKSRIAPLERTIQVLTNEKTELTSINDKYVEKDRTLAIHSAIREAATKAGVKSEAIEDALLLGERVFELTQEGSVIAKENSGFTQGSDPAMWFSDLQNKRPHWWGETSGGGAGGNRGGFQGQNNPWSDAHWNLTEQGKILNLSASRAEKMAEAAGTTVGGRRPAKK